MNRKILLSLIAAPALIFLFHAAVYKDDGGDPKKGKSKAASGKIEAKNPAYNADHQLQRPTEPEASLSEDDNYRNAVVELRKETAILKKVSEKDLYEDFLNQWQVKNKDEVVSETIEKRLIESVKKADFYPFNKERMFSRCPSGYAYVLAKANFPEGGEVSKMIDGYLTVREGCRTTVVAVLRFNTASDNVELKVSDEIGYTSVDKWLELRAEV